MDRLQLSSVREDGRIWQPLHLSHDYSSRWLALDRPVKLTIKMDSSYTKVLLQLETPLTEPDTVPGSIYDPIRETLQYTRPTMHAYLDLRYSNASVLESSLLPEQPIGSVGLMIEYLRSEQPLPIRSPGVLHRSISRPLQSIVERVTLPSTHSWQGFWWCLQDENGGRFNLTDTSVQPGQFQTASLRVNEQLVAEGDASYWSTLSHLAGYGNVPLYYWCHLGKAETRQELTIERTGTETAYLVVYLFAL